LLFGFTVSVFLLDAHSCFVWASNGKALLVGDENPFREGILFLAAGREASVVGNGCILEPELLMLPGRLVGRTRCQGAAPLGGNFTFLTGISHFRSSTIPTATRSAQGAMPLRMPITKRGKKAASPRC